MWISPITVVFIREMPVEKLWKSLWITRDKIGTYPQAFVMHNCYPQAVDNNTQNMWKTLNKIKFLILYCGDDLPI